MIARVFDDDYSMYYCTLCSRPMKELHQANEHEKYCGKAVPVQPLAAAPDTQVYRKPWQGLTDGEYQQILIQHDGAGLLAFYNLVEAKLREKNG